MSKKILKGKIVSNKMKKTVVVEVMRRFTHPTYHRAMGSHKKYYAHAEGDYKVGEEVTIEESKPVSKLKRWKVVEKVIKKAKSKKPKDSS